MKGLAHSSEIFNELFDAAGRVLVLAKAHQSQVDAKIAQLQRAADQLRELADTLPRHAQTAVMKSLSGAADQAAHDLSTRFAEAEKQARLAGERYERAARWFPGSVVAMAVGAMSVLILGCWGLAFLVVPTAREIRNLTEQRDQLTAEVAALEARGGGLAWADCEGQRCFQVEATRYGKDGKWAIPHRETKK